MGQAKSSGVSWREGVKGKIAVSDAVPMEAVIIACVGSLAGLIIGFGCGLVAEEEFQIPVEYSVWVLMPAPGVAAGIGVASCLYPALKACRMLPVEAL
jgi:ABC-type antimicrobial peptide transport system permease subunit